MIHPEPSRPHMPGYGIREGAEGMLPWSSARERLENSRNYWVASVRPDGRPHVMPVWAVWIDDVLYFSTARTSRKARNLVANSNCVVSTESGAQAVVVEGAAAIENDHAALRGPWDAYRAKYNWSVEGESMFVVRPSVAFAFTEDDNFTGTATRWRFR